MLLSNPESSCWTVYQCFINVSIQTAQQLRPLANISSKNTFFRRICAGSFLVISHEPVKVETESRSFSAQHVYKLVHHDMNGNETGMLITKYSGLCAEGHRCFD